VPTLAWKHALLSSLSMTQVSRFAKQSSSLLWNVAMREQAERTKKGIFSIPKMILEK